MLKGIAAVFVVVLLLLFFFFKELRVPVPIKLGAMALLIIGILAAYTYNEHPAMKEERERQALAESQSKEEQAFKRMRPDEHLKAVKELLKPNTSRPALLDAVKHLNAIPESAPEHLEANALRNTVNSRLQEFTYLEELQVIDDHPGSVPIPVEKLKAYSPEKP